VHASGSRSKAVELEDVKFHQCVRLSRFENDRTISFVPPDGDFELMSYRLTTQVKPLIWIESHIERHSHSRVDFIIKVRLITHIHSCAHTYIHQKIVRVMHPHFILLDIRALFKCTVYVYTVHFFVRVIN